MPLLTPNQAAAKALELFCQGAKLCQSASLSCDKRTTTTGATAQTKMSGTNTDVLPCSSSTASQKQTICLAESGLTRMDMVDDDICTR